jgi:FMN phosphatase YigB (HAD superfamily)
MNSSGVPVTWLQSSCPCSCAIHPKSRSERGASAARTLHIGDDPALDVDGALAAGLQAAWVQRPDALAARRPLGTPHHEVSRLDALADRLGA